MVYLFFLESIESFILTIPVFYPIISNEFVTESLSLQKVLSLKYLETLTKFPKPGETKILFLWGNNPELIVK